MSMKLGILCSHPIQYYAPIFRELAKRVDLQVFYACRQTTQGQADAGFGVPFEWDIDLLQGYQKKFMVNVSAKPDPSRFFGCDTPGIVEEITNGQFDAFLVLGWGLKSYWQAVRACRKAGVPVMVRGDSRLAASHSIFKRALKKLLYPILMRQFDACLYVGNDSKKYYQAYGAAPEKLFFSPHSIDNERFRNQSGKTAQADAKLKLGLDSEKRYVLFVGKFIDIKRPMDMLMAALILKQKKTPVHLLFVGDGPLRPAMELFAKQQGLDLQMPGFINQAELPMVYRAADLLVLPSENESWGLVVNEAMACGLPVVVSDAAGCSADLVKVGETGCVFAMGNLPALADAIDSVFTSEFSVDVIQRRIDAYSPGKTADGVISAVQWLQSRNNNSGNENGAGRK